MVSSAKKPNLLLHICCVGCGAYISEILKEKYDISLFFYNPNIFPKTEYEKRKEETVKIAGRFGLDFVIPEQRHSEWLMKVRGLENEPEKGSRCHICYEDRLTATALHAQAKGFSVFSTTLTISPHKLAVVINQIGNDLAKKHGLEFLSEDFKKNDGFKKAALLSRELGLYRQNYCGCEFSIRKV